MRSKKLRQEEINFATMDFYDIEHLPKEYFDNMTNNQAADVLQKQVDSYHRGGEWSPRKHFGRALEIAVDLLRKTKDEVRG